MSSKIQIKRGTTAAWASDTNDTTLAPGQLGIEYTTTGGSRVKVGEGTSTTDWANLNYLSPSTEIYKDTELVCPDSAYSIKLTGDNGVSYNFTPTDFSVTGTSTYNSQSLGTSSHPWNSGYINNLYSSPSNESIYIGESGSYQGTYIRITPSSSQGVELRSYIDPEFAPEYMNSSIKLSNGQVYLDSGGIDFAPLKFYQGSIMPVKAPGYNAGDGITIPSGSYQLGSWKLSNDTDVGDAVAGFSQLVLSRDGTVYVNTNTDSQPIVRSIIKMQSNDVNIGAPHDTFLGKLTIGNSYLRSTTLTAYSGINLECRGSIQLEATDAPVQIRGTTLSSGGGGVIIRSNHVSGGVSNYVDIMTESTPGTVTGRFRVTSNSVNPVNSGSLSCGTSSLRWSTVYANNGTIQTSDRDAKSDIHYIEDNVQSPQVRLMSMQVNEAEENINVTTNDLLSLVKTLMPAVFAYKNNDGSENLISDAMSNNNTEVVQLGLIADDIKDNPLFNYIGATMDYEEEVTPAIFDDEGTITTPAVTETKTTLGLKAVPLAVLALTACKNLLQRVEQLENK